MTVPIDLESWIGSFSVDLMSTQFDRRNSVGDGLVLCNGLEDGLSLWCQYSQIDHEE